MYKIEVDTKGFAELLKASNTWANEFHPELEKIMRKAVLLLRSRILRSGRIPFQTGTLRRSITTAVRGGRSLSDITGEVGTNLPYAAIHEFGGTFTRNSAFGRPTRSYSVTYTARRYLRQPFAESISDIQRLFERDIEIFMLKA